ncbi:uncharacterized protein LOC128396067 [Panonychus citri]|uniref:uncharacterized protein LOC128396067 n=1 Tax=Panonychus citri TaxID=50023 RepID=UPI0023073100|nr:uncharacterized protein LOC128396067 [Panonychus citri]
MNTLKVIVLLIELSTVYSLRCYTCNSIVDPYCTNPFNPPDFGPLAIKYTADCDATIKTIVDKNDSTSIGVDRVPGLGYASICRKTVQKVDGQERVHRSCGWYKAASETPGCYQKTGSMGITHQICSCRSDFCNGSVDFQISLITILIPTIILIITTFSLI